MIYKQTGTGLNYNMSEDKYKPKKVDEEKYVKIYNDILRKMMTFTLTFEDMNDLDSTALGYFSFICGKQFRTTLESFKICCDHLLGITKSESDEKLDIYLLSLIIKGCLYPLHPTDVTEGYNELASYSKDLCQIRLLSNIMHLSIKEAEGKGVTNEEIEKLRKDAKKDN